MGKTISVATLRGKIEWYDHASGFGTVRSVRGDRALLHRLAFGGALRNVDLSGARLEFDAVIRPKGLQIFAARLLD